MAINARLSLVGFDDLKDRLKSETFQRRFKKHVGQATLRNALEAERAIKEGIHKGGVLKPNAPLTQLIKGSSRPLVDTGELVKSITSRRRSYKMAVVGVLKSKSIRDKDTGKTKDLLNIAFILHYGASIKVTDKMRGLFAAMSRKHPERWKPLSPGTKVIVIPKRPFLSFALMKGAVRAYKENWAAAVELALKGVD